MSELNNITPEMARQALIARGVIPASNAVEPAEDNYFDAFKFLKGTAKGAAQGLGDIGASAINWPISGIEKLTGKEIPHVPHPHITGNPETMSESIGETLGELGSGFGVPGGAGYKAAQWANKGYNALRAGKELPFVGKLLAGGAGGALEGAASHEENRPRGAMIGSLLGAGGHAIPSAINFAQSIRSKNIAKTIPEEYNRLKRHFGEVFSSHLNEGELAGANKFLKHEPVNESIFKKAGESKLLHALQEYNANPTLKNAHEAQSDLNKIARKYAHRTDESKAHRRVYEESLKAKNRLLQQISEAFEKSGAKQHGSEYQQARIDYANELAPYKNSKAISDLLGKGNQGIPKVRPQEFADKLLKEEEFLARSGHKHRDLLRREKWNKIKKNKFAQGAATVAGGGLAYLLPYEIRSLLNAH